MYKPSQSSLAGGARNNFVTKVYSIISLQLLLTVGAVVLNMVSSTFARIQATYSSLMWLSFIVVLGTMLALCKNLVILVLSPSNAKVFPTNMILLGVFTLG